jgi:hypothetical protein
MRVAVASQAARICGASVRDRTGSVRRDYVDVKVNEPFPGNVRVVSSHSMGGMACRTREAIVDMSSVFGEACVRDDLIQVVTLCAECVGTIHTEVGIGIEVGNELTRAWSLAELITALEKVRPRRSMRTIRAIATKLAIVIAVVTIGAE